ncbi:hypothetical protein [Dyella flagellata]|uniref:Uncharacterized protein n=1 Tax=Dyella flagellata TaxID=1867833 RepID=A0ABQ5X7F7_9GAMM|nr:hypothetical protein [Dyella flagellata]GLQ87539.1 hypothetical protein GCM10007898_11050 [Dyella flagellata]
MISPDKLALQNGDTYTLLHVRNSQYLSAVASGIIVTGPTDDGFVHLHFFRESQRILSEEVPAQYEGDGHLRLERGNAELKIHLQREEVATLAIPESTFGDLVEGLMQVARTLSGRIDMRTKR